MKKRNFRALALGLPLLGSALVSPGAFAESYDIIYEDGAILDGDTVTIDTEESPYTQTLTPLIDIAKKDSLQISTQGTWEVGYQKLSDDGCRKINYIFVDKDGLPQSGGPFGLTISNGKYENKIKFVKASLENFPTVAENEPYAYIFRLDADTSEIRVSSSQLYTESTCTEKETRTQSTNQLIHTNDSKLFLEMKSDLKKNGVKYNFFGLHLNIEDIDSAQSYMILNEKGAFSKDNLFAADAASLQQEGSSLKNMIVAGDNSKYDYIYSQYDTSKPSTTDGIMHTDNSNVFVLLSQKTVEEGLHVVYGFGSSSAWSNLNYYARQYKVTYKADKHGEITGITSEDIVQVDNPSGTSTKSDDGYELAYWKADVPLRLSDGTTIEAGEEMTEEQVKMAMIIEDTTFTAYFEKPTKVPDTGAIISKELSGAVVPMSIAGIITLAIVLFYLPRINHKKVNFKK